MSLEVKGLIAALIAGLAALGLAFGVSAIVVRTSPHAPAKPSSVTMKPSTATVPASSQDAAQQSPAAEQQIAQGHEFYIKDCSACHGAKAQGVIGPTLHHLDLNDSQIATTIKNGVKGKMPAFGNQYNESQIQSVVAYIRSLK